MPDPDVLIIGAGLAGLACARALDRQGVSFQILEASDAPGGRVRTNVVDGFQLDRGFQVLLTAYPEAEEALDYDGLELHAFAPGALVRYHGRFCHIGDPWRESASFWPTLFAPVARLTDLGKIYRLRRELLAKDIQQIFDSPESTTLHYLKRRRFSRRFIDYFFKPWMGGAMLDLSLAGSSRMFEFLFKMFAAGDAVLPRAGMGAIPAQLAAALPSGSIRTNARAALLTGRTVRLESGEVLQAGAVVVATESAQAARLLGWTTPVQARGVWCFYFAAKEPPIEDPLLVLSGSSHGPVSNLAVLSAVAPQYAPKGESLISASVIGWPARDREHMLVSIRSQLKRWFGLVADEWRLLRTYRIERALPVIYPLGAPAGPQAAPGVFVCGDHCATPSINGALESGRLAAEAVIRTVGGGPI